MNLEEKFCSFIKENKLLNIKDKILIAFSGGSDSVCLFHLLRTIEDRYSFKIALAHISHQIKLDEFDQKESNKEFIWVKSFAKNYNYFLYQEINFLEKKNIQAKARKFRYNFFEKIMLNYGYNKLLLAHHLDDQIETFFLNLMRSSISKVMNYKTFFSEKKYNMIRPLLDFRKKDLKNYLENNNLNYFNDINNLKLNYRRNVFRINILSSLEKYFPDYRFKINNFINKIKLIEEFLNKQVILCELESLIKKNDFEIFLDLKKFNNFDKIIQKRLLKNIFSNLWLKKKINTWKPFENQLNEILKKINQHNLKGNIILFEKENIKLYAEYDHLVFEFQKLLKYENDKIILLKKNNSYKIYQWQNNSYEIIISYKKINKYLNYDEKSKFFEKYIFVLDKHKIKGFLNIRKNILEKNIKLSFNKTKKISSILIDAKIPIRKRNLIRYLYDNDILIGILNPLNHSQIWFSKNYYIMDYTSEILLISSFQKELI